MAGSHLLADWTGAFIPEMGRLMGIQNAEMNRYA